MKRNNTEMRRRKDGKVDIHKYFTKYPFFMLPVDLSCENFACTLKALFLLHKNFAGVFVFENQLLPQRLYNINCILYRWQIAKDNVLIKLSKCHDYSLKDSFLFNYSWRMSRVWGTGKYSDWMVLSLGDHCDVGSLIVSSSELCGRMTIYSICRSSQLIDGLIIL